MEDDCWNILALESENSLAHWQRAKQLTNPKLAHSPEPLHLCRVSSSGKCQEETMGFGRGALLWLIGIPLPIILILALFMHH
jgi:hypothetical protein